MQIMVLSCQFLEFSGKTMKNKFLLFSALSGFFCIAFGAFAAHGLEKVLDQKALAWIETGLQYQMFHTLALMALGLFQIANFSNLEWSHFEIRSLTLTPLKAASLRASSIFGQYLKIRCFFPLSWSRNFLPWAELN